MHANNLENTFSGKDVLDGNPEEVVIQEYRCLIGELRVSCKIPNSHQQHKQGKGDERTPANSHESVLDWALCFVNDIRTMALSIRTALAMRFPSSRTMASSIRTHTTLSIHSTHTASNIRMPSTTAVVEAIGNAAGRWRLGLKVADRTVA